MRRAIASIIVSLFLLQNTAAGAATVDRYTIMNQAAPTFPKVKSSVTPLSVARNAAPDSPGGAGTPVVTEFPTYISQPLTAPVATAAPSQTFAMAKHGRRAMTAATSAPFGGSSPTGITKWWTFNGDAIPGVGSYQVNVGTGNLVLTAPDINLGGPGVALSYTRVYNAMSQHDANNTDGSVQGNYGNSWTSTSDTHIGWYNSGNTISVFDAVGTRYDYQYGGLDTNGNEIWTAPTGTYATLTRENDPNHPSLNNCFYQWLMPDGTAYFFYSSIAGKTCAGVNLNGRLAEILAPNSNSYVHFTYTLDSNGQPTQIVMTHSDGQTLTLTFTVVNNKRELHTITASTGQSITYLYDTTNNLTEVDEPANGSVSLSTGSPRTYIPQVYYYTNGTMEYVESPRYVEAGRELSGQQDGNATLFGYDASNRIDQVWTNGVVNLQPGSGQVFPSDGTNTALQSGTTPNVQQNWFTANYTYNTTSGACGTFAVAVSSVCDNFGHATNWVTDSLGRVTETQMYVGSSQESWLYTDATWDANNNLTETTDVASTSGGSGNATDYAYDAYGNVIAIAQPSVSNADGTYRPTTLIKHGSNHPYNIQAVCDPAVTHSRGLDWSGVGTPGSCASTTGATYYTYGFPDSTHEPVGRITDVHSPNGYHYAITYAAASEPGGVDIGMPTSISGDAISQSDAQHAPTSRAPTTSITYDSLGRVITKTNGVGTWTFNYASYTSANKWQVSVQEPGVSASTYACHADDGTLIALVTPKQSADAGSTGCGSSTPPSGEVTLVPDADGNILKETHHYGGVAGITQRWYDGDDRLVEVLLPQDSRDMTHPFATRYLYGIAVSGDSVSFNDTVSTLTYASHGNMFKTQRYVEGASITGAGSGSYAWYDVTGNETDAINRVTGHIHLIPGAGRVVDAVTWDTTMLGRPGLYTNGVGDTLTPNYDTLGRVTSRTMHAGTQTFYSNGTLPGDQYTYDGDGRVKTANNDATGTALYSYDNDGNVTSYTEAPGGTNYAYPSALGGPMMTVVKSPTVYKYGYYADDLIQGFTATGSAIPTNTCSKQSGGTTCRDFSIGGVTGGISKEVAYNTDGNLAEQWTNYNNVSYDFTQTTDADGRVTAKTDPLSPSALSVAYDPTSGLVSTWTIPSGSYTNFSYDSESEPTSFTASPAPASSANPSTVTLGYSIRGELLTEQVTASPAPNPTPSPIVNYAPASGFLYAVSQRCWTNPLTQVTNCWPATETWDPRVNSQVDTGSYDNAGRYTQNNREYDAANRTLRDGSSQYTYGASDVPADNGYQNTTSAPSFHSSMNDPLYGTDGNGNVTDVKTTGSSDITPQDTSYKGITVYDRDMFGVVAAERNTNGPSAWSMHNLFSACEGTSGSANSGNLASASLTGSALGKCSMAQSLYAFRSDGYWDGTVVWRGVRTFDPATQQWSTPDAYGGNM